jgi:hypothetical protein
MRELLKPTLKMQAPEQPASIPPQEPDEVEWSGGTYRAVLVRRRHSGARVKRAVFIEE